MAKELKVFKNKKFIGYMTPSAYIKYLGQHPYATHTAMYQNKKILTKGKDVKIFKRKK